VEEQHARAMIKAAGRGDLEEVRRLVQQNRMLLDGHWNTTSSPLVAAANGGRVEVVRYLLDEGADINHRRRGNVSAIEAACEEGRLEVAVLLLARGADTAPDRHGWTPLKAASSEGHTDIVELLLAHGCGDVDAQGSFGRVALHYACSNGHAGVARALLGAGANPHVVDHWGDTPLMYAGSRGLVQCVALLQVIEPRVEVCTVSASLPSGTHLTQSPPFPNLTGVGEPLPPLQGPPPPRFHCHAATR
jgi:cytohesin